MTATLPTKLNNAVKAKLKMVRLLSDQLAILTMQYAKELTQYRPEKIEITLDETQGVDHFVIEVGGEWVSSAYTIGELEDQLCDRLFGSHDALDVPSTVRLGGLEECLERTNNGFTPKTYRVVVADCD